MRSTRGRPHRRGRAARSKAVKEFQKSCPKLAQILANYVFGQDDMLETADPNHTFYSSYILRCKILIFFEAHEKLLFCRHAARPPSTATCRNNYGFVDIVISQKERNVPKKHLHSYQPITKPDRHSGKPACARATSRYLLALPKVRR